MSKPGLQIQSQSCKELEVFGWSQSGIPNSTGSRSQIFFVRLQMSIFYITHLIGNSCWNGTISFETFVETEISSCAPQFPLILTAKVHSLYVKESESEILERLGLEILKSWCQKFGKSELESDILPLTPQPWSKLGFDFNLFALL